MEAEGTDDAVPVVVAAAATRFVVAGLAGTVLLFAVGFGPPRRTVPRVRRVGGLRAALPAAALAWLVGVALLAPAVDAVAAVGVAVPGPAAGAPPNLTTVVDFGRAVASLAVLAGFAETLGLVGVAPPNRTVPVVRRIVGGFCCLVVLVGALAVELVADATGLAAGLLAVPPPSRTLPVVRMAAGLGWPTAVVGVGFTELGAALATTAGGTFLVAVPLGLR